MQLRIIYLDVWVAARLRLDLASLVCTRLRVLIANLLLLLFLRPRWCGNLIEATFRHSIGPGTVRDIAPRLWMGFGKQACGERVVYYLREKETFITVLSEGRG